jgi:small-conductance mechanosensitive channel
MISEQKLFNWQAITHRRARWRFDIAANNAPEAIERCLAELREVVKNTELVVEDMWLVHAEILTEYKLQILVQAYFATTDYKVFLSAQEKLILALLRTLRNHGISVAMPLEVQDVTSGGEKLGVPRMDDHRGAKW